MTPKWGCIDSTHIGVIGQSPKWGYDLFYFRSMFMSDDQASVVTLKVRVTPEFREKIVKTAKENNRSMNQEIVSRLEQSFSEPDEISDTATYIFQIGLLRGEIVAYEMALLHTTDLDLKIKLQTLIDAAKTKKAYFIERFNKNNDWVKFDWHANE